MIRKQYFVSNLAWSHKDFNRIYKLLKKYNIKGLDIAPIKINKDWSKVKQESLKFKKLLDKVNLKVNALQGIFYKTNFNIFNTNELDKEKLLSHFKKILDLTKIFKCKKIILGSSNFRDKKKLKIKFADIKFVQFFKNLDPLLKKYNVSLCFEPIPKQYGENYLYNSDKILKLLNKINSENYYINFDSSMYHFRKYNKKLFLRGYKNIKNIQISQKNFTYFHPISSNNKKFLNTLKELDIKNISIEIISKNTNLEKLENSLRNLKLLI
jgi:sugar phosphate isomerase/epimerase